MAGARHDSPRPREGEGWHIGSAQLACHPVGLERWKLLCARDLQKAVWLSLCLWYVGEIHTHLFCPWISPEKRWFQLKHKKREEKIYMFDVVTFALHAVVLEGAVLQVTCLRFGSIVTFSELVSHIMGAWEPVWAFNHFLFPSKCWISWYEESSLKSVIRLRKLTRPGTCV